MCLCTKQQPNLKVTNAGYQITVLQISQLLDRVCDTAIGRACIQLLKCGKIIEPLKRKLWINKTFIFVVLLLLSSFDTGFLNCSHKMTAAFTDPERASYTGEKIFVVEWNRDCKRVWCIFWFLWKNTVKSIWFFNEWRGHILFLLGLCFCVGQLLAPFWYKNCQGWFCSILCVLKYNILPLQFPMFRSFGRKREIVQTRLVWRFMPRDLIFQGWLGYISCSFYLFIPPFLNGAEREIPI